MENFTPVSAIAGGLLIGLAATIALWANGRIVGISGILAGTLFPRHGDIAWRWLFLLGLLCGGLLYSLLTGQAAALELRASPGMTVVAGLLVGFGTRLGSGCTSGHGICGIARFSRRSFAATLTFIVAGIITVGILRHTSIELSL